MSQCCITGHIHEGTPEGVESEFAGLRTYIATPPDGNKAKAVLFIHDIFGYELINSRLLADDYARAGFYVYLPDFLEGDPMPISLLEKLSPTKDQQEGKTPEEIGAGKSEAFPVLGTWMVKHHPQIAYASVWKFVGHLRANKEHKHVGVVGFGWGGWHAVHLTHKGADPSVDVAVACHPGLLTTPEDFEKVEKPLCVHVGDMDDMLPPSEVEKIDEIFKHKYKCALHSYQDQVHGFACRGDLTVAKDRLAKETVAEKAALFLKRYMKLQ